jgi:predicted peptidase
MFLHGVGEIGDDLDIACRHGFMKHVREEGKEYPFICVAPQCPREKYWSCYTESLLAFLDYICETLRLALTEFISQVSVWEARAPVCSLWQRPSASLR